jgi:hypothetical protein
MDLQFAVVCPLFQLMTVSVCMFGLLIRSSALQKVQVEKLGGALTVMMEVM